MLANARFHQQEECLKKIEAERPKLHLEFLPEYSPDCNFVALVWHSAKEYTAQRLIESVEELESFSHQLLDEASY